MSESVKPRLKVVIVGAGICGLAAGAHLREFADVVILESTNVLKELGAAVHIGPNAYRIVKEIGGDFIKYGGVPVEGVQEYHVKDGKTELKADIKINSLKAIGTEWVLCHRVDVQEELRRLATSPEGPGKPCELVLGALVTKCDADEGVVTCKDGRSFSGDVIIGTDGIKSAVRKAVAGPDFSSAPSGHSAYRGLIPAEKITSHPELSGLPVMKPQVTTVAGDNRRLVTYPTRNGTVLNFVAILPDEELHEISEEKWSAKGDVSKLVESFKTLDPIWQTLLAQTPEVGLWQLRDQEPFGTWTKGRAIVLGDAAHAMLPHMGQGASQAIEDSEAAGACLRGVSRDGVTKALERILNIRYKRATRCQLVTRSGGIGEQRRKARELLGETGEGEATTPQQHTGFVWAYFGALRWEAEHPEWLGVGMPVANQTVAVN